MVLAFVLVTAGVVAAQGLVVKGDRAAWLEIQTAWNRLGALKSYRVRGTMPGGMRMLQEVVRPDRDRTLMEAPGMKQESITVGQGHRWRINDGPWQCATGGSPVPDAGRAPGAAPPGQAEVTAERGPKVKIGNDETQSYRYWFGSRKSGIFRLFVLMKGGLPRRLQMLDAQGNVTMTLDYYDFNAAITITLPKCEQRN
jgi:hypothetical protein